MKKEMLYLILVVVVPAIIVIIIMRIAVLNYLMMNDNNYINEDNNVENSDKIDDLLEYFDESRLNSLYSSAKDIANWYDEAVVADALGSPNEQRLAGIEIGDDWICIGELFNKKSSTENPEYGGKSFAEMVGLSANDVNLTTTTPYNGNESSITFNTCSSIRDTNNGVEVLLVAEKDGSFDVTSANVTYAFSTDDSGKVR